MRLATVSLQLEPSCSRKPASPLLALEGSREAWQMRAEPLKSSLKGLRFKAPAARHQRSLDSAGRVRRPGAQGVVAPLRGAHLEVRQVKLLEHLWFQQLAAVVQRDHLAKTHHVTICLTVFSSNLPPATPSDLVNSIGLRKLEHLEVLDLTAQAVHQATEGALARFLPALRA